jgi:hypothetical protein
MHRAVPPLPIMPSRDGVQLNRDNFTFTISNNSIKISTFSIQTQWGSFFGTVQKLWWPLLPNTLPEGIWKVGGGGDGHTPKCLNIIQKK